MSATGQFLMSLDTAAQTLARALPGRQCRLLGGITTGRRSCPGRWDRGVSGDRLAVLHAVVEWRAVAARPGLCGPSPVQEV